MSAISTGRAARIAVNGLGAVLRNIHLPAYARLRGRVDLVAGCDPDLQCRAEFSRLTGVPTYEDEGAMLSAAGADIVSICSPPQLHKGHVLAALAAGCHAFCEKPMAESLADADTLISAAASAQRRLVVNSQFPAMKIHVAAKAAMDDPRFGRLLFLHATQTFRPTERTEVGWRSKMSRRVGLEFGVHVFELIRFFFGEDPLRISATMPKPFPESVADVIILVTLEFSGGRAASIVLDRASKGPERYLDLRLDGQGAAIVTSIGGELRFEAGLHTRQRQPFLHFAFAGGGKAVWQDDLKSTLLAREGLNPFASATAVQLGHMLDAINTGGECPGAVQDYRKTLAIALAAYDAAAAGRTLELKPYLAAP